MQWVMKLAILSAEKDDAKTKLFLDFFIWIGNKVKSYHLNPFVNVLVVLS